MSVDMWVSLVSGPAGALLCLIIALYVLVRGQLVVPGFVDRANREQIKLLNEEAKQQDELLRQQSNQLTEQRVANARLELQTAYLTEQIQKLTTEIEGLRVQLRQR